MKQYLYTPFDGCKVVFAKLSQACLALDIKVQTVRNHFAKHQRPYVWQGGKLEVIKNKL